MRVLPKLYFSLSQIADFRGFETSTLAGTEVGFGAPAAFRRGIGIVGVRPKHEVLNVAEYNVASASSLMTPASPCRTI